MRIDSGRAVATIAFEMRLFRAHFGTASHIAEDGLLCTRRLHSAPYPPDINQEWANLSPVIVRVTGHEIPLDNSLIVAIMRLC